MSAGTYAVSVWDDEAGHWRQRGKVRAASARAAERAYIAKHPYLDTDDVQVKKAAPKARKSKNPARRSRRALPKRKANGQFARKARR